MKMPETESLSLPDVRTAKMGARRAGRAANAAAGNSWIRRFMRFGYVARGVIYLLPGALALKLAIGVHGSATTSSGAIAMIGQQPFGRILLLPLAAGLAAYSLWGAIRTVLDPLRKGHSSVGVVWRAGYALSAIAYAGLFAATIRYIGGALMHMTSNEDWTRSLLAKPFGPWLVGGLGLAWIAGGITQIVSGWRGTFETDLELERMSSTERRWAGGLGRVGFTGRGAVFAIIGGFLISAAIHSNPHEARGMDGALLQLARQPFGTALLAAAALGLITFGVFSILCTRWARMSVASPAPHPDSSKPSSA